MHGSMHVSGTTLEKIVGAGGPSFWGGIASYGFRVIDSAGIPRSERSI
jgi:hypothetical protein